jgi:hypothetical protein
MGSWLDRAAARIAARTGAELLASHLAERYGIDVAGLTELDLGVYRVDRRDGPAWAARLFPATSSTLATWPPPPAPGKPSAWPEGAAARADLRSRKRCPHDVC